MTDAARRARQLEEYLLRGRALDILSEDQEDATLEEMDALWLQMTVDEREEFNRRAAASVAVEAPEVLGLRDCLVTRGSREAPRMAS